MLRYARSAGSGEQAPEEQSFGNCDLEVRVALLAESKRKQDAKQSPINDVVAPDDNALQLPVGVGRGSSYIKLPPHEVLCLLASRWQHPRFLISA